MKFERTGDNEHPYAVTFETCDEIEVVAAAFREAIYRRAEKGNAGSVSEFDAYVAEGRGAELPLKLRSIDSITGILDEFHEATDDSIVEIPNISCDPPYANEHIYERFRLGQRALRLSTEIKEAVAPPMEDPEEMVRRFRADLDTGPPSDS